MYTFIQQIFNKPGPVSQSRGTTSFTVLYSFLVPQWVSLLILLFDCDLYLCERKVFPCMLEHLNANNQNVFLWKAFTVDDGIHYHINVAYSEHIFMNLRTVPMSGKSSYHEILQCLETVRFVFKIVLSLGSKQPPRQQICQLLKWILVAWRSCDKTS